MTHNEVKMSVPEELELGLGKRQTMVFPGVGLLHPQPQPRASRTEDIRSGAGAGKIKLLKYL